MLSPKIRNKARRSAPITSIQQKWDVTASVIRQVKEIKDNWIVKEEVKLSLLLYNMILFVENSKEFTYKKLFEQIKKFSKIKGYKVNLQKSILFLYTANNQYKNEINQFYSPIALNGTKDLGINLTKEVGDLYTKNYKTLLRKIRKDQNECREAVHRFEDSISLRCQLSSN